MLFGDGGEYIGLLIFARERERYIYIESAPGCDLAQPWDPASISMEITCFSRDVYGRRVSGSCFARKKRDVRGKRFQIRAQWIYLRTA